MKAPEPAWLHVGALFDGSAEAPAHDAHVVFTREKVLFVGKDGRSPPADLLRPGQAGPDLDAPDQTLLPTLTEAHSHFFLEGGELDPKKRAAYLERTDSDLLKDGRRRAQNLVRLGIGAVRDAGDKRGVGLALSREYKTEAGAPLPYIESPGPAIHHRGRYGTFMAEPVEDFPSPRACVEARVAAGADRIKLIPTGIIDFAKGQVTSKPQMSREEVAAFVAAARDLGRQTFAHASGDIGIEHAIEGGVDSIEHGYFLRPDQLARMRDRRTAWVPTFAPVQRQIDCAERMGWTPEIVGHLRSILEGHAASLLRARSLGVIVVAGSDAGSYGVAHGAGLLYELELMERAGLSARDVLHSATGAGSGRLEYGEKFGRIEAGYRSRFILTRHSPMETVANLRKARTIFFDGDIFESADPGGEAGM